MANPIHRLPQNAPGPFYVDDTCIDCDFCRSAAPQIFIRDNAGGFTYVYRQPVTPDDLALAEEAMLACPTETIGREVAERNAL